MGLDPVSWAAIATAVVSVAAAGVQIATAPGAPPKPPPPPKPPAPPPLAPPPAAPTAAQAGKGVAKVKQAVQRGVQKTTFTSPLGIPSIPDNTRIGG